ncbi:MAG TPA: sugar-binding protein [Candidatus Methylacidiphilales bacterium]
MNSISKTRPDRSTFQVVRIALALLLLWPIPASAAKLSFGDDGVRIEGGSMGNFTLNYPSLVTDKPGAAHAIIAKSPAGTSMVVQYEGGATLHISTDSSHRLTYSFSNVPANTKSIGYRLFIDFSFQQGGKWKMQNGAATAFPIDKPENPHLYQGHAGAFQLINAAGESLTFHFPDYSYLELQDNRAWNWSIYQFIGHTPFDPNHPTQTITIDQSDAGAQAMTLVDEFGQIKALDWPDKVHDESELKSDVQSEKIYYGGLTTPAWDKFGGLPESGKKLGLQSTGFFHVEKKEQKWLLVDPDGNLFFHLGVCSFAPGDDYTLVAGRRGIYDWLPPLNSEFKTAYRPQNGDSVFSFLVANMIRKYGKPYDLHDFVGTMIDRVRKWGFNSIGAFSPVPEAVVQAKSFPYVLSLPFDSSLGKVKRIPGISETWDPFDPDAGRVIDANFAKELPTRAGDPLLIGYFLANEPLYEDIPKVVPGLKGSTWACKRELVQMLKTKYQTIAVFDAAWGSSATSFDELDDAALSVGTKAAANDMHDFTGHFFETYYQLVSTTFHKYDPHHMLIGNRFQPGTINNEQLCRIAGKYLDIMSFNYYSDAVDKDFLNRIYAWTGRPMFLSEFYWAASKQSGLAGGREVATQQERGLAYRNYVEQSATLGYVVGVEWFTLADEASTGRWFSGFSGERSNSGLISVTDRPWKPLVAEMKKTNDDIYRVINGERPPYVYDDPRFTQAGDQKKSTSAPHSTGPIVVDGTTQNWPGVPPEVISGKHLVLGSDAGGVEGSFKVCWDEQNLYILATIIDPTPLQNKQTQPADYWNGDALEIFLGGEKIDEGGPLLFSDRHLVINAGQSGNAAYYYAGTPNQYASKALVTPGGDQKSYTIEAAIPWEVIGIKPQAGTELRLDLAIDDSVNGQERSRQITWNGTDKNSGDRTHWGWLKLLP